MANKRLNKVVPWLHACLVGAAVAVSPFFLGYNIELLCIALALLILWIAAAIWQSGNTGLRLPRSGLAATLLAYVLWLGLSQLWSPVSSIALFTFWWMAVWPLAFIAGVIDPRRDQVWSRAALFVLLTGIGLAASGLYQWFVLHDTPSGPFLDQNLYAALLTLMVFPLASRYLGARSGSGAALWAAILFLLCFAVALARSRSAMLAFAAGIVTFAAIGWHPTRGQRMAVLGALVVGAFALANVAWGGGLAQKLATLQNPEVAGHDRFLIWQGTWRMIMQQPWLGVGLGMYSVVWPRFRDARDVTGGYFAHNDYLQNWVDAGLPALVSLVAVLASAVWMILRLWRKTPVRSVARTELAGLAAGFVTLPVNSVFNYNFFVVPSVIIFAMLLARMQMLDEGVGRSAVVPITRFLSRRVVRVAIPLVALVSLLYFGSIATASLLAERAVSQVRIGEYSAATGNLELAHWLWPQAEHILVIHADIYRHVLAGSDGSDQAQGKDVFTAALANLDAAERLNPFRPHLYLVRATLLRQNPNLAGENWAERTERNYRRAIELDPWNYEVRVGLATHLLGQGAEAAAQEVLDALTEHATYDYRQDMVPYLMLTATLRERRGDAAEAAELRRHASEVNEMRRAGDRARREKERLLPQQLLLDSS